MTHQSAEMAAAFDHDNRAIALIGHDGTFISLDELFRQCDEDTIAPLREFEGVWTDLHACLQQPVLNDAEQFSGYTGYRTVTFSRGMGRTALGFNLLMNGEDQRIILAERRKIYPNDRRRLRYESDSFCVETKQIRSYPTRRSLRQDLGRMRAWADKFLAAEPYSPADSDSNPV